MDHIDVPPSYAPPPPPKRLDRPKITLQIPESTIAMTPKGQSTGGTIVWGHPKYHVKPVSTSASHISDPHFNPFLHMYHNKASEFMFKQFEGFKDFTMNTAKSGLSAGEKTAFWFYNKLKLLSKKWFTHFFLILCLALYSVIGAAVFMALEGPYEVKYDKNLTEVRRIFASRIHNVFARNKTLLQEFSPDFLTVLEQDLVEYEANYTECMKHVNNNDVHKKTWSFWNSMFYAGTIYTTIVTEDMNRLTPDMDRLLIPSGVCLCPKLCSQSELVVMNKDVNPKDNIKIPTIKAESETQTVGQLVSKSPEILRTDDMDSTQDKQGMSIRKRRNLSKNRGQAARQREKTPEPSRTLLPHEDTTTSDDEDLKPQRNSREIEADNTYEEMKRLVQEKSGTKDPVYDLDTDKVLEERAMAANERRRRSISPFALPDKEELSALERKGSFIDPNTKLLSTNYTLNLKDEETGRRSSLVIDTSKEELKHSLVPNTPSSGSPKERDFQYSLPSTPKRLEELVYPDEKKIEDVSKKPRTPIKSENVFTFEDKDKETETKQIIKSVTSKVAEPSTPGELVTKVIQLERTPSKKLLPDKKPVVEVRERIVRTPSRKTSAENKPNVAKQSNKPKEEHQSRVPPVKPARSKSATRFGNKTSESEMSEDQGNQYNTNLAALKRKAIPTPRRFVKHSPRANRSQSMHRPEDLRVIDKTGTGMSQTSREIIELMQKARARSLSIPKDDPRLPAEYKDYNRKLKTPNKTPSMTPRNSRGISCPKTIQIITDKEILSGINTHKTVDLEEEKGRSRQSSGYVDASQSEYTSSCYSTSPSENEFDFDLSERTAELTRKLNILSQEVDKREVTNCIILGRDDIELNINEQREQKSVLRKRSVADAKIAARKESKGLIEDKKIKQLQKDDKTKTTARSRWKLISNWRQFKEEQKLYYDRIYLLRNRCICDLLILVIMCGLGGMMFKTLEGSFENAYKCGTRNVKRDFIESLWRGSHYLREEDWKSMARKKLFEFEEQLHTAHEAGVSSYSGQRSWNFMNSFVYCFTLVTTIGYGHIAPKTPSGRVATIVYAIIGIPLFLIVLADFGKLFTRIIKFFWAFIRRFYYTRSCRKVRRTVPMQEVMKGLNIVYDVVRRPSQIFSEEEIMPEQPPPVIRRPSDGPPPLPPKPGTVRDPENETDPGTPAPSVFEIDDEFNLPISLAIFILVVYIIIGAMGYNMWEKWSFFESFYFVFISMSTIGLGDLVPDHPMFMMASILYLVSGLALTSMCINVVQVKLSDTFKQASAKLGATIGLKVAEEDGSLVPITPPPTEIAPIHKPKHDVDDAKSKEEIKNR